MSLPSLHVHNKTYLHHYSNIIFTDTKNPHPLYIHIFSKQSKHPSSLSPIPFCFQHFLSSLSYGTSPFPICPSLPSPFPSTPYSLMCPPTKPETPPQHSPPAEANDPCQPNQLCTVCGNLGPR